MGTQDIQDLMLPLCSLKIAFAKEFDVSFLPGYEKVSKNILRSKGNAFLLYRRRKTGDKIRWHPRHLKVHDLCDAFDEYGNWCFAQIIQAENHNFPGMVKVHYTRWLDPKYDEWIPLDKKRLAPYNSKPKKKTEVKIGRPWKLSVDYVVPLLKKLHEIRYDPDAIAKECEVSLILMVDRFLRKKLVSIDEEDQYGDEMSSHSNSTEVLKNMVYQLFRKIVEIGAWMLQDGDRIREKFIVILRKVLFANSEYAYFFENEGYHKKLYKPRNSKCTP